MKKLTLDMIETIEIDTEFGFAWAKDETGNNLFQVCCDENGNVDHDDCGHDWGQCGDYNESLGYKDLDDALKVFLEYLNSEME